VYCRLVQEPRSLRRSRRPGFSTLPFTQSGGPSTPYRVPYRRPIFPQELGSTKQEARGFSRGPGCSRRRRSRPRPTDGVVPSPRRKKEEAPRGLTRQSPLPPFCRGIVFLTISTLSSSSMRLAPFPWITIYFLLVFLFVSWKKEELSSRQLRAPSIYTPQASLAATTSLPPQLAHSFFLASFHSAGAS
jgi:hypothetical protein